MRSTKERKSYAWLGSAGLLFASLIWGSAFVAQSVGMDYIGPFTFNAARSLVGSGAIAIVILVMTLWKKRQGAYEKPTAGDNRTLWLGGLLCGVLLCLATSLQQIGLVYTTVGKAGFLSTLYIIEVPLIGMVFGRRIRPLLWGSVMISLTGMYLLCMNGGFRLSMGDLLVFLCSVAFSFHIIVVDHIAPRVDGVKLSCIQFLVSGVLSAVLMLIFETPSVSTILSAAIPILYVGVLSSGVGYTLQIVGQKWVPPTLASLLMSMESVVSFLSGMLFLHEIPTAREGIGAFLMFSAVILAQLPERKRKDAARVSE